mmetsp:Transcript_156771/g.380773  ORF Transcript_156771/g.380773 Transcript_156771/m.380773 type:complete len:223 (-) Transcript_156771:54-722(-)
MAAGSAAGAAQPMFNVTSRFKEAVGVINGVAADKFPLVLVRVIRKLHLKAERIFSDAEEAQLMALLSLSSAALHTALECASYVLEQAAYRNSGVDALASELKAAGFSDAHVASFQRVWGSEGRGFMDKLRARSLGGPLVLSATKWQMSLQLGSSGASRAKDTSALFEFSLAHADDAAASAAAGGSAPAPEAASRFKLEFSGDQLYDFFARLEQVQEQLDALS